ncbi:MAG: cell cycle transcriptional regulator TrcR [Parvularculaceae bacterium]
MSEKPLMPIATAVWLIENTRLTFDQIADFCVLHPLQVKGIADGDVGAGVRGIDPISNHQLTREELEKAEADPEYRMLISRPKTLTAERPKKGPRYTPVSKRQNRPDAIAWLIKHHSEISDAQIAKLLGTTKATIQTVRDRSHWNAQNLSPTDPVGLGLCSQLELDMLVRKAAAKKAKLAPSADQGPTLEPVAASLAPEPAEEEEENQRPERVDVEKVFGKLGGGSIQKREDDNRP